MAKEKSVHAGHRERLKKRLARELTFEGFEPHEILEMLLYYAIPQGDTNPLAHRLIDYFGSLPAVFTASTEELQQIDGVGPHTASLLSMIGPLISAVRRLDQPQIHFINGNADACKLCTQMLQDSKVEQVAIILMDPKGKVLNAVVVAEGTACGVEMPIPKIMEWIVRTRPSRLILTHNHPSGKAQPSLEDDRCTRQLMTALHFMDVKVDDHIIVGADQAYSYYAHGRMEEFVQAAMVRASQNPESYY